MEALAAWLDERAHDLAEEWSEELRARGGERGSVVDEGVADFLLQLALFLPFLLGPNGAAAQPLWTRACELFGTMAARRGLAAGEVIEEMQVLRELLIRDLYQDPPAGGGPTMREALRLNRALDLGVTHASVGHTDAMFFSLLEGQGGVEEVVTPEEAAREAREQLRVIQEELVEAVGRPLSDPAASTEH